MRPTTIEQWAEEAYTEFRMSLVILEQLETDKSVQEFQMVDLVATTALTAVWNNREMSLKSRNKRKLVDKAVAKLTKLGKSNSTRYYGNPPMIFAALYLLINLELGMIKRPMMEQVLDYLEPMVAKMNKEHGYQESD